MHLFEPLDRQFERANINVKLNGFQQRIEMHQAAVSDHNGDVTINVYRDKALLGTGGSVERKPGKDVLEERTIRATTIDACLPGIMPTAVKIDVEGHELSALKGMDRTLRRAMPNLVIEVWSSTRNEVLKYLTDLGYHLQRIERRDNPVNNYFAVADPADLPGAKSVSQTA